MRFKAISCYSHGSAGTQLVDITEKREPKIHQLKLYVDAGGVIS